MNGEKLRKVGGMYYIIWKMVGGSEDGGFDSISA